jgi:hypothetical protein
VEVALAVCRLAGLAGQRILDVGKAAALSARHRRGAAGEQVVATVISAARSPVARSNARALGLRWSHFFLMRLLGPVLDFPIIFSIHLHRPDEYETLRRHQKL